MRCCGGVNIIIIRSQPSRRECNAETTDDEDGDVDVGGVDGDDGEMDYYYYCDYYSQGKTMGRRDMEPKKEKLRSSEARPSGGPRGRRGACGSCNR